MKSERILPVFVPIAIIAFCVLLAAGVWFGGMSEP